MAKPEKKSSQIIYGIHPVLEALKTDASIEKLFYKKEGNLHERLKDIRALANEKNIPIQYIPEFKLKDMSRDTNHQGVVAQLSAITYKPLEQTILQIKEQKENPVFLMLDGITDVRNFGAIARTAECMGIDAIIVPSQGSAAANGTAVKVSAGALYHIPICRTNHLVDAIMLMQAYGIQSVAVSEKAEMSLYELEVDKALCLIMGAEDKGVSKQVLKRTDQKIRIPMYGKVESLNVSVAAGIVMSEVVRRRRA
ncbi:MAG: 23S rRNA (guanosine(2251)-2'-O)-methyltransferase RlmB [Bacteroidota bacterium]